MRIAGIVAEYDPFHLGHLWHLDETRRRTDCDFIVVAMDGSFTQRGEPALLSKRERVRLALLGGADAVFELPALFAVRSADAFARGGVGVLGGLGVDALSFGAECADIDLIRRVAALSEGEDAAFTSALRERLAAGESYPRAYGAAAARLGVDPTLLSMPNTTLAVEYLRAIERRGFDMQPVAIERRGSYHGALGKEGFASASAIRSNLYGERREEALNAVPTFAWETVASATPLKPMDELLLWTLRGLSEEEIASLADVPEGLEHRVKALAMTAPSREALIDAVKCKRYTRARLVRLTTHALLGLTGDLARRNEWPRYARLLGLRRESQALMTELSRRATLPIISDPVTLKEDETFQLECRATDLRALLCQEDVARRAGQELTGKFITL